MKIKLRHILILLIIPIALCLYFYVSYYSQLSARKYISEKMSSIISTKDNKEIERISFNKETYNFLMNLPKDVKFEDISDAQGGDESKQTINYEGRVNNQKVEITLRNTKKVSKINKLFPSYEIMEVRKW